MLLALLQLLSDLGQSLPFPEPRFPRVKAKAASHLLLVFFSPEQPWDFVVKEDKRLGGYWQFSLIITVSRVPYLYSCFCILNLIQTPLLVFSGANN